MLKLHEQTQPKKTAPTLHVIRAGKVQKKKNKQKLHFRARGYWKRNCPQNLAELLKNMNLSQGASSLAIGIFHLCIPSGLEIVLNNCHYALSITRGVISCYPKGWYFEIDLSNSYANDSSMYAVSNKRVKLDLDFALLWHCHLRHISKKRNEKLQHDGLLNSTVLRAFEKCVSCMSGKMVRKPYTHQVERAIELLGLIHTDVGGPFKIMSRQGASYFVTFTDDFSRYGYVYLLKHKHEVFETFKVFQKEVENQLDKTIKSLHSDHGGEYMSQEFLDHLKDHGIITHRTPPYTPQHNGVSERRNRTLLDMVRSMMSQTTLPKTFWDYALETAARILNIVPTKKVEKTPYEVWHGQASKLSYLKVWGCEALVKRDTLTKPDKLEPRYIKCIFVGYPKETMGYSFYYPPENKVLVARNGLITQEASGSLEDLKIIQEEDTHPSIDTSLRYEEDDLEIDEPQSDIIPIRRSTRTRHAPNRMCLYIDAEEHKLGDLREPVNYKAALLDPDSDKWLNAMNVELQSMKDNKVWDLVDLPPNGKTIGSKWLFKKKTDMDGAVHTYKAHIRAIRILIAITAFYNYEIWKMDVKTSFLVGCKNPTLEDVFSMKDLGEAAYILGIKIYGDRSRRLIGLCQSAYIEENLKALSHGEFQTLDVSPMQEKLRLSKSQGALTPAELKRMPNRFQQNPGDLHWTTVKNIMKYLRNTKDMFLVYEDADDLKSQIGYVFVLNGGAIDWKSAKQSIFATFICKIDEYIAAFEASKESVCNRFSECIGISKGDVISCQVIVKLLILGDHKVRKEAEYIAAYDASKEAVWVRKFISGLGVVPIIEKPISMYCDNTGAITIANESGITKGARHLVPKSSLPS
ncbi:retrotransposon protein, putative, ty1-copia subclass [Tanacetum coccineum]